MDIKEIREKFPQYSDLSDAQLADALYQKFYSDMPRDQFLSKIGMSAPTAGERFMQGQKSVGVGAAQTIASGAREAFPLLGRAIEFATTGKVGTIMDRPLEQFQQETQDYNSRRKAAGDTGVDWMQMLGSASSPWNVLAGRAGLTGGGAGITGKIVGGMTAGTVGGAMTPGTDKERLAGMALGGGLGGAIGAVPALTSKMYDIAKSMTRGGAERKAGTILRNAAQNPDDALANLMNVRPVVPGSPPTTGMASGDEGVASLLNVVQDRVPEVKAAANRAAAARETARTTFATKVGGTADDLANMEVMRNEVTRPMREAVLSRVRPIPANSLTDPLDKLAGLPEMAGKTNQAAIAAVKSDLQRITNPETGAIDPVALYEIRKDIGLMMDGKLSGDAANMKFARKVLSAIKGAIDDQIDNAAEQKGTWKAYLNEFAGRSKAIDQMATFQDVIRRSGAGSINPDTGEPILYASKLNNILRREGRDLAKTLTNDQMDALRRLAADLSAEQAASRASRSATGNSVTFGMGSGNAMLDAALGRVPGGGMLTQAMQFLKSGQQQRTLGLLGESVQDPSMAARLMQAGAPVPPNPRQGLLTGAAAATVGATVPPLLMGVH
ncbi:MAG: hypothetical protein M9936_28645 [Caldilinea sp.]|nr:hypothetical protein [Caldilinea sp.]